jgi:hypothetical protein
VAGSSCCCSLNSTIQAEIDSENFASLPHALFDGVSQKVRSEKSATTRHSPPSSFYGEKYFCGFLITICKNLPKINGVIKTSFQVRWLPFFLLLRAKYIYHIFTQNLQNSASIERKMIETRFQVRWSPFFAFKGKLYFGHFPGLSALAPNLVTFQTKIFVMPFT